MADFTQPTDAKQFWCAARAWCAHLRGNRRLLASLFECSNFLLQQRTDAVSRQIHLADIDSQSRGDFMCRPFLAHITIKDLKLLRLDLLFHPRDRCLK